MVDPGVALIGQPLAVAVDKQSAEARGLHGVFAECPDLIEIVAFEVGGRVVERREHGDLADGRRAGLRGPPDDLGVAKRHHGADFRRHAARIGGGQGGPVHARAQRERGLEKTDSWAGFGLERAGGGQRLAEANGDRATGRLRSEGPRAERTVHPMGVARTKFRLGDELAEILVAGAGGRRAAG